MHARNVRTGAPIVATLERVHGRTKLVRDRFNKHDDGVVEREIEGPTKMLWHTSETIACLDANDEEVDWDDIEVYEPDTTVPEAAGQDEGRDAGAGDGRRDPAARAGNTAARAVERIVAEVDNYHHEEAAAAGDGGDNETAMNEALETFTFNASTDVAAINVTSGLASPGELDDTPPLAKHADEAVIHLKGEHATRIHCFRDGNRFRVSQVIAIEDGHQSRVAPNTLSTTQLDLYASTILGAWGL